MPKSFLARAGNRRNVGLALAGGLAGLALAVSPASAAAAVTERVSVTSDGAQARGSSGGGAVSADGRFVAFASVASNLVAGDTNGTQDVFVRDRHSARTERVSVASDGAQANADSYVPAISADGRFVAFVSAASNLVAGDTNGLRDLFVHDRRSARTERVSVASDGTQANADIDPWGSVISADGRVVAFASQASNLVAGDTNATSDVFVRDRRGGSTERVSLAADGAQANQYSGAPSLSADGRFVAFTSHASNLVAGDTNNSWEVFVRDRRRGTTERLSLASGGAQANDYSTSTWAALSADGRHVAFASRASNLVVGDLNGVEDAFVHDRRSGRTELVSVASGGAQANTRTDAPVTISGDGRFVAFSTSASNLVAGDGNRRLDVFVRDRQAGRTERVSVGADGIAQANNHSEGGAISADGRFVVFSSRASNLVAGDTNATWDVFVHDRGAKPDGGRCTILGTAGDDVLAGTAGDDVICGLGGADTIGGGTGHDVLRGGGGGDRLSGEIGRDWLDGGPGSDHLTGGSAADVLSGGPGGDRATYWGRDAAVTATIGDGANDGAAGERDDVRSDVEHLSGGRGDDMLTGDSADNYISGNAGNDRLIGAGGHDQLVGGDGDDTHDANDGLRDSVICGNGTDSVLSDPLDWLSHTCGNR